jgi:serine/threonine protein kinase
VEAEVALADDDLTGQSVAHYRIVRLLGRGGMGVVYAAEDARLRRPAALKFLAPRLAGDRLALERFLREAQAASALSHPNIATIYDIGEHGGGAYIAMELLEGATLAERLTAGPLDVATWLKIADDVLEGLGAAHEAGIVHRDLKPANLFVTSRGTTKILDLGGRSGWHARLYGSRADPRRASGPACRFVRDGRRHLRDGHRRPAVSG